jgi:hypothetical protein
MPSPTADLPNVANELNTDKNIVSGTRDCGPIGLPLGELKRTERNRAVDDVSWRFANTANFPTPAYVNLGNFIRNYDFTADSPHSHSMVPGGLEVTS